jgi:hypothetical protein
MQNIHVAANIRLRFSHTGKYLLQNVRLEANIRKTLSKFHIQTNFRLQIFAYKRIFACKYSHTREYSLSIVSQVLGLKVLLCTAHLCKKRFSSPFGSNIKAMLQKGKSKETKEGWHLLTVETD